MMLCFGNSKKKKKPLDDLRAPEQSDLKSNKRFPSKSFLNRISFRESRRSQSVPCPTRPNLPPIHSQDGIHSDFNLHQSNPVIRSKPSQDNSQLPLDSGQSIRHTQSQDTLHQNSLQRPKRFTTVRDNAQLSSTSNIHTADLSQVKRRPRTSTDGSESNRFSAPQLNCSEMLKYANKDNSTIHTPRQRSIYRMSMIEEKHFQKDESLFLEKANLRSVSAEPFAPSTSSQQLRHSEINRKDVHPKSQQRPPSPSPSELTVTDLKQIADRQHQQIKTQQNVLKAKEERLRYLKRKYERQSKLQITNNRLKELKETIEDQKTRLSRLNKLKNCFNQSQRSNNRLSEELNLVKSLFVDKNQELSLSLQKISDIKREIHRLKSLNRNRQTLSKENLYPANSSKDSSPLIFKSTNVSPGYRSQLKINLKIKEAEKLDNQIAELEIRNRQARQDITVRQRKIKEQQQSNELSQFTEITLKRPETKSCENSNIQEENIQETNESKTLTFLKINPSPLVTKKLSVSSTKAIPSQNVKSMPSSSDGRGRNSNTLERIRQTANVFYQPHLNRIEQYKQTARQPSTSITLASSEESDAESSASSSSKSSIAINEVSINIRPSSRSSIGNISEQKEVTSTIRISVIEPEGSSDINKNSPPASQIQIGQSSSDKEESRIERNSCELEVSSETSSEEPSSVLEENSLTRFYNPHHVPIKSCMKNRLTKKLNSSVRFHPFSLLLDASLEGDFELVKQSAALVNDLSESNDEGITALHNSICAEHIEICLFLIDSGANVNAFDNDGWTPLHCAVSCGLMEVVKRLVESGAAVLARTHSELKSPLDMSLTEVNEEVTQYIREQQESLGEVNGGRVYTLFAYNAVQCDELSFLKNVKLFVLKTVNSSSNDEWVWCKDLEGKEGLVPVNYISNYSTLEINPIK